MELHGVTETRSPPNLIDGNEEFEVEAILTHWTYKNRQTQYLIKWKGYDSSKNTWESESNLSNAEDSVSKSGHRTGKMTVTRPIWHRS